MIATLPNERRVMTDSYELEAALASGNGKFVKYGTSDQQVTVADSAGIACVGAICSHNDGDTIAANAQVTVCRVGRTRLQAGDTITKGDQIACTAAGLADTATGGQYVLGVADEDAVSGNYFMATLNCPGATVV